MNEERNLYRKAKGHVKVSWLNAVIGIGLLLMIVLIILVASNSKGLTVHFETYGVSPVEQQFVKFDEHVTMPEDPAFHNREFLGWYTDPKYQRAWDFEVDRVESDLTLHAKWE